MFPFSSREENRTKLIRGGLRRAPRALATDQRQVRSCLPRQPISEAYLEVATQKVPNDPQGRTYAQVAAERQFRAALKGSTSAIREIADRLEGKPQQRIEMTHHDDFLAGRTDDELEFFAVHGYWPDETDADADRQARYEHDEGCSDAVEMTQLIKVG